MINSTSGFLHSIAGAAAVGYHVSVNTAIGNKSSTIGSAKIMQNLFYLSNQIYIIRNSCEFKRCFETRCSLDRKSKFILAIPRFRYVLDEFFELT